MNRSTLCFVLLLHCSVFLFRINVAIAKDESDDDGVIVEDEPVDDAGVYQSPEVNQKNVYFSEHFDDVAKFNNKWVKSETKKQGVDENIAKYDGVWEVKNPVRKILNNDLGLVLTSQAKHAAISAMLSRPFKFDTKPLFVQYEVTMQEGQNCGGAYLKLLSSSVSSIKDLKQFYDQTPYTIMFGPDKCGNDNKLHFIFRHKNPKNGTIKEKHCKKVSQRIDDIFKDKEPHLYTLILNPDNTFIVKVDSKEVNSGSLLDDFTPPVNPPEEIDDPDDKKPEEWDEREKIIDPAASKPDDWDETAPQQIEDPSATKPNGWLDDEPEMISDPDAKKPDDWDEEMDGEWEAPLIENPTCANAPGCGTWKSPMIPNPAYKGIWRAPLIPNPNYKGKWIPKKIKNPDYFRDDHPFKMTSISAVGFELWSMSPDLLFDNLIISDDSEVIESWTRQTFDLKKAKLSKDAVSLWGRMMKGMNYKPGWWALYFVYCMIPISAYVWYLRKRATEGTEKDSIWGWIVRITNEQPWLWAVYLCIVLVFIGFILYMCCGGAKEHDDFIEREDAKKTDAVTEDDPHPPSDGEESNPAGDDGIIDLESEDATAPEPKASKQELEQPLIGNAETSNEGDGSGDGQRKRKPRKE